MVLKTYIKKDVRLTLRSFDHTRDHFHRDSFTGMSLPLRYFYTSFGIKKGLSYSSECTWNCYVPMH